MENNLGFPEKFQLLHKSLQLYFNKELKYSEISGGSVFYFLLLNKENMTQAELTKHSQRDKAHTNRVITHLINKGYVSYVENESVKNKKLSLTEKGSTFAKNCKQLFKDYICKLTSGIDKKDLEATSKVLEQLANNAKKMIGKSEDIYV